MSRRDARKRLTPYTPITYLHPLFRREPPANFGLFPIEMAKAIELPVIDVSLLHGDSQSRSKVIREIGEACRSKGIFHVINHGVAERVIDEALNVSAEFFDLPPEMNEELISSEVTKPVRYSPVEGAAKGVGRDFIKLYTNPFKDFLDLWPKNPPDYRDKIGTYAMEVRKLGIEIVGAITESLNLSATYLKENVEKGMHILAINNYPPTGSDITIGVPSHSDHSIITLLLQTSSGLQIMDKTDLSWKLVPYLKGTFQVLVGDHLEVLSNGRYGSAVHRVIQESSKNRRISIAGLHSLGMDEVLETANELVNEEHPRRYKGSSLRDYIKYLSSGTSKPFLQTLLIDSSMEND